MFGFGAKKKEYLLELSRVLSDLGNISVEDARGFVSQWENWVLSETYRRDLDPLMGAVNLAKKSMERIFLAHQLRQFDGASVVPNFMLLVALKADMILKDATMKTGIELEPSHLVLVIDLPVDVRVPEVTYRMLLDQLIADDHELGNTKA